MSAIDNLLNQLPIDSLASQVGASPDEVRDAVASVLPAMAAGLNDNAANPAGATSLSDALAQHADSQASVDSVDTADGSAIADHIFGGKTSDVAAALGASKASGSATSGLIQKLIPYLAPLVMAWLANQVKERMGGAASGASAGKGGSSGGGANSTLQDVLGSVVSQASKSSGGSTGVNPGGIMDVLSSVLSGGGK